MRPSAAHLRWGLHGLVLALAAVVSVRAVVLGEAHPWLITALVVVFEVVYVLRLGIGSPAARGAALAAMVALWAGLTLLQADAAYLSVGLFLIFLTELKIAQAVVCVVMVTCFDIAVSATHEDSLTLLAAPLLGAFISVLIGLGFRLLFDTLASQDELIGELRFTRAELARSEHAAGRAMERQHLAREIHDTVAQSLSSIQMLLHAADGQGLPSRSRERIAMARETAAAALGETRHIIDQLAPPDLTGSSLRSALDQVCARSVAAATLVVDGTPLVVSSEVEVALVRLTQGALGNVERHAGAGARAVVSLSWGHDTVRLDVVDDGLGFDSGSLGDRSFGLASMQARVNELGGEFSVESEPGHTAVSASFPIRPPEDGGGVEP